MRNALHLLNQNTIIRLFAAFFCFTIFTNEQIIAAPYGSLQDVQINSLKIFAGNPSDGDSIFLVVDATLTSSDCGIEDFDVIIFDDNHIEVDAAFWQGDAQAICNSIDTLFIGQLSEGEYSLVFNLQDSLAFKVPYVNNQACNADFTTIIPACYPDEIGNCNFDFTQFSDISSGNPTSWYWSFGDGQYSQEQHPSHSYEANGVYQVCLKISNSDGCEDIICKNIKVNYAADSCIHKGTVYDYTGLDGCGYVIFLDNGIKLEPVKFMSNIELRDSMRVKLSYVPVDMASICMVGQTAIITCIQEIDSEPCNANFNISVYGPASVPYTYYFENKSRGEALSYEWDFGDGTTSTEINPTHTFSDTGIYVVCLKIYSESGCEDQICKRINVGVVYPDCKAQFTHQYIRCDSLPFDFCPGYFVQFNDESYGEALLYQWDFGDGNVSYEQNPSHFYENNGFYTVTLKIESATDFKYCADKITKQIRVAINDSLCNAYFEYKAMTNHHYEFQALLTNSDGDAVEVNWDFGDGTFGSGIDVEHVFDAAGVYNVCATVTTANGCTSTYCKTIVIDPTTECLSTFDYTFLPCECLSCACLKFTSNTNDDVVEWYWDFGDGSYSYESDPYHTFFNLAVKKYTVCLTTVTAGGCKSVFCKDVRVNSSGGYEVPWEPVIAGDENHIIIIPEDINAPELQYGDYLGLFFKDPNGNDICGGMLEWKGEVSSLTAWGVSGDINELALVVKNGFLPDETFGYKIWKHATNQIIEIAEARYEVDEIITDSSAYRNDGLSKLTGLRSCDSQEIRLHRGWNMISLNVEPANNMMKHMFGNNQNVLVKDAAGDIKYFPYAGIEDGEWNNLEGYKIKVWENTGIKVCGTDIEPQTSIPLQGDLYPTFLPYLYQFEYPIEYALYEIKDDIRYVQSLEYLDGSGKIMALNYIPAYGINQIGNMKPGLAYRLSLLTSLESFTYPYPFIEDMPNPVVWDSLNRNTATNRLKASFENSDQNRILVIPEDVIVLNEGDEINIYTSDNFFAGSWLYTGEGNTAVTLWDNPEIPDYSEFEISIVDSSRNEIARYYADVEEDVDVDGTILELKKATVTSSGSITLDSQVNVYPNPANEVIRFELPGEDNLKEITVQVNDLGGRVVLEQNINFNGQIIEVNIENLKNGVYVLQIQTLYNVYKTKFVKGN